MGVFRTQEEVEERAAADRAKVQQVAQSNAETIAQHDILTGQIVNDLNQALADLDSLQAVKDLIGQQSKESVQIINSLIAFDVKHNLPTIRANVQSALKSFTNGG